MHGLKTSLKFPSHNECTGESPIRSPICCPWHMAVPVYIGSHLFPLGQMTIEH